MDNNKFEALVRKVVAECTNKYHGESELVKEEDVFIVWFCKTIQNWKAIAATSAPDHLLFEVTYNGDKGEAYVDMYEKKDKLVIKA